MNEPPPSESQDAELQAVGERLRAHRPQLSPLELDRVKTGVLARTNGGRGGRRGAMRVVALSAVAVGVLAGGTGVTLGLSTLVQKGSAAAVQYQPVPPPAPPQPPPPEPVPPPDDGGVGNEGGSGNDGDDGGGVRGISGGGNRDANDSGRVQPQAQIAAVGGDDSLPFTGYLVIPALGIGLLLTGAGALMLRRHPRP